MVCRPSPSPIRWKIPTRSDPIRPDPIRSTSTSTSRNADDRCSDTAAPSSCVIEFIVPVGMPRVTGRLGSSREFIRGNQSDGITIGSAELKHWPRDSLAQERNTHTRPADSNTNSNTSTNTNTNNTVDLDQMESGSGVLELETKHGDQPRFVPAPVARLSSIFLTPFRRDRIN